MGKGPGESSSNKIININYDKQKVTPLQAKFERCLPKGQAWRVFLLPPPPPLLFPLFYAEKGNVLTQAF